MSVLHQDLLRALRDAGDEGVPENEMALLGGRWWKQRLFELRRSGHVIGETDGVFVLVVERGVESDLGDPRDDALAGSGSSPSGCAISEVALGTTSTLFELTPLSAIDPLADAA